MQFYGIIKLKKKSFIHSMIAAVDDEDNDDIIAYI